MPNLDPEERTTEMNKTMLAAATAVIAAAAFVPTAEAGRRGGFGHHHFRFQWTPTFESHSDRSERHHYVERERRVIRRKPVEKVTPAPVVKYADGKGRQYDKTSQVWFDGKSQCWSGKQAFVFKGGSWFYGSHPWQQANGTWQTSAPDAPAPVACDTVAAFAAKMQAAPAEKKTAKAAPAEPAAKSTQTAQAPEAAKAPEAKSAKPADTAKAPECKKYFPSVGEMVSVPCE
jgi:hypothetical protein